MFDTVFHAEMRRRMKVHYHERGGKDRRMLRYYRAKYGDSLPAQGNMSVVEYVQVIKENLRIMKENAKEEKRKAKTTAVSTPESSDQHGEHDTQEKTEEKKSPVEIGD